MSGENRRHGVLAFRKQSAYGTPATIPGTGGGIGGTSGTDTGSAGFALPIVGGGLKAQDARADLPITRPTNKRAGQFKQRAWGGGTVTVLAHLDAIGLLLYETCFAKAVSGSGDPWTHTFTLSDALPSDPLTFWSLVGDHWEMLYDAIIQRMTLRAASGDNVQVEMDVIAFNDLDIVGLTEGTDYTLEPDQPRAKFIDSVFKADSDSATPTAIDNAEAFELTINRTLEIRHGTSLTPKRAIAARQVDASLTLTYDTTQQGWDFYRVAKRGVATAPGVGAPRSMTQGIGQGSFDVKFGLHEANASHYLRVFTPTGGNPPWEYNVERPDADPAGGFVEMQVVGPVIDPGPGLSEVTFELANGISAYS